MKSRGIRLFIAAATLVAGSSIASAHEGMEHLLGTVKAVTANSVTVESTKHQTSTVMLDVATTFTNKGAKASATDLKVGDRVAIEGKDGDDKKLHAVSVKWGAVTAGSGKTAPKAAGHTMDPNMKMDSKPKTDSKSKMDPNMKM